MTKGKEYEKELDEWLDLIDSKGISKMPIGREKDEKFKEFKQNYPKPKWEEPIKIDDNN